MNKYFLGMVLVAALSACQNSNSQTSSSNSIGSTEKTDTTALADPDAPKVAVEKTTYEFGTITQGEKVKHEFKFKNVGKTPLIITNASATCGCTVPDYPKNPIKPGEEGIIAVVFDSAGKLGQQDKVVTVTSNANPSFDQLHLVGEVKEKK